MTGQAREAMILRELPLALKTARRFFASQRPRLDRDDIRSEAMIGLIQAVDSFDPSLGVQFRTYAITRIQGRILEALRRSHNLSRRHYKTLLGQGKDREATILALDLTLSDTQVARHAEAIASTEAVMEEALIEKDEARRLREAVANLTERQQYVIRRHYLEGVPYRQIEQELSISASGAQQLRERAFAQMRRWLS